jgi:hypothetical protein
MRVSNKIDNTKKPNKKSSTTNRDKKRNGFRLALSDLRLGWDLADLGRLCTAAEAKPRKTICSLIRGYTMSIVKHVL